jgi:SAM-dependent methyltransferase
MTTHALILDRLSSLADFTRSRLLLLLEKQELMVSELCAVLKLPQSTVSRHLKVLSDEGWIGSRGEGTSRYYAMTLARLDPAARELWSVVRGQIVDVPQVQLDYRRVEGVLAKRRSKIFFTTAAGMWDKLRTDMIGGRADLLGMLELLDERWVVGDLGCGAGHITEALAPCVGRVIAVDESGPMLDAARARIAALDNVELREGHIESLPIENDTLDVAILFLVAHFISDPAGAIREVRRVLKPDGRLIVVDLCSHDRADYIVQLGHVWQGFTGDQVTDWLSEAGFGACRYRVLPEDADATGPPLFVASGRKADPSRSLP